MLELLMQLLLALKEKDCVNAKNEDGASARKKHW